MRPEEQKLSKHNHSQKLHTFVWLEIIGHPAEPVGGVKSEASACNGPLEDNEVEKELRWQWYPWKQVGRPPRQSKKKATRMKHIEIETQLPAHKCPVQYLTPHTVTSSQNWLVIYWWLVSYSKGTCCLLAYLCLYALSKSNTTGSLKGFDHLLHSSVAH